jgi:hypothetical protein
MLMGISGTWHRCPPPAVGPLDFLRGRFMARGDLWKDGWRRGTSAVTDQREAEALAASA